MMMVCEILFIPVSAILLALSAICIVGFCLRGWLQRQKVRLRIRSGMVNVAFLHPYCNAGGGGERVLWCGVKALQEKYKNISIIIYTEVTKDTPCEILDKVRTVFNINLDKKNIKFIYLNLTCWVEAKRYPYFTLLCQSIGSFILGLEALCKFPPDVFIDTTGYAFTLPLFRFIGCSKVGCYVHYPTISTDMLCRVQKREYSYNNATYVVRNPFLTRLKIVYYNIFAKFYRWVGRCSETIMVNSSWTENHILDLWDVPFKTHRVYPPCDVDYIKEFVHRNEIDTIIVLSVGQFRAEKDHPMQLQALYELRTLLISNEDLWNKIRLVLVGSCRNKEDYERLKNIQDLSKHLSLENNVDFKVNISYGELLDLYGSASIGIHTMWNEHFGIGIVESMAAGIIMVAHKSGGPLLDIIETSEGSRNGYLATDAVEYANCIMEIIYNTKEYNDAIRRAAMSSVERFSEKEFKKNFLHAIEPLFMKNICL